MDRITTDTCSVASLIIISVSHHIITQHIYSVNQKKQYPAYVTTTMESIM